MNAISCSKKKSVVAPEAAHQAISEGTGRFDERRHPHIVETYQDRGTAPVAATEPGVWVTYRHYPDGEEQRVHASAYDIRSGKVKAFTFPVHARVVPRGRRSGR